MKYAIISDVHSNVEALRAVIQHIHLQKVHRILFLGDSIGYGPNPNEAFSIIKEIVDVQLNGNHEGAILGLIRLREMSSVARAAILWTDARLKEEFKQQIAEQSSFFENDEFVLVHASLEDHIRNYLFEDWQLQKNLEILKRLGRQICFFGHTHIPIIYSEGVGQVHLKNKEKIYLERERFYMINPGSVGQPRDNDPRASYIIFDSDEYSIENFRVEYDWAKTRDKILDADLPVDLGYRLEYGV